MSENSQDITIGNQQERPLEAELGWLGGILDGEGSLSINVNSTHRSVYPRIQISSSEYEILDKAKFRANQYIASPPKIKLITVIQL